MQGIKDYVCCWIVVMRSSSFMWNGQYFNAVDNLISPVMSCTNGWIRRDNSVFLYLPNANPQILIQLNNYQEYAVLKLSPDLLFFLISAFFLSSLGYFFWFDPTPDAWFLRFLKCRHI